VNILKITLMMLLILRTKKKIIPIFDSTGHTLTFHYFEQYACLWHNTDHKYVRFGGNFRTMLSTNMTTASEADFNHTREKKKKWFKLHTSQYFKFVQ